MNTKVQNPTVPRTLADLLKTRGTLTQKQILSLLQPVISSLSKMHSQGLVHGHISPETILLRDSRFLLFSSPLPEINSEIARLAKVCPVTKKNGLAALLSLPMLTRPKHPMIVLMFTARLKLISAAGL